MEGGVAATCARRLVEVEGKLGHALRVRLAFKLVALLLQQCAQVLVVRNDTIVDDSELVLVVRAMRMCVHGGRLAVRSPASVRHCHVAQEGLVHVDVALGRLRLHKGTQGRNLADLLE